MPVLATCPSCSRTLRVADELAGQPVRCPSCDTIFTTAPVPEGDAPIPVEPLPEPEVPAHEQEACPSCGARVPSDTLRCPSCGAELEWEDEAPRPWERRGRVRRDTVPHRGALILVLGIVSIVLAPLSICCSFVGIIPEAISLGLGTTAWVLGRRDLARMRAREMDPEGYGLTQAGFVCGIIGSALSGLGMLLMIAYLVLMGTMIWGITPPPPPPVVVAPPVMVAPDARAQPLPREALGMPREELPMPRELP